MLRVLFLSLGLLAAPVGACAFGEEPTYNGKTLREWMDGLKNKEPNVRCEAVAALAALSPDPKVVVPKLLEVLDDKDDDVRWQVYRSLTKMGVAAVPPLCTALKDDDARIRSLAAKALARLDKKSRPAIPMLQHALKDKDKKVRIEVARALWDIDRQAQTILPVLIACLTDEDATVRLASVWALTVMDSAAKPAVPALLERLKERNTDVRVDAAWALWRIDRRAKVAIPVLVAAMKDNHYEARINIPSMLDQMRPDAVDVIPVFIELLKDRDASMRSNVASSLGSFGPKASAALPALLLALKDENAGVRQGAAWSLGRIATEEVKDKVAAPIRGLLKDPDALVRVQAARTFWKLTGDTKETLPLLIETIKAQDNWTLSITLSVLREMKSDAKGALPALRERLDKIDPKSAFYQYARDVMKQIDPQTAPAKK